MTKHGRIAAFAAALAFGALSAASPALAHGHGGGHHRHDDNWGAVAAGSIIGLGVGAAIAHSNNVCPPPGESNSYSKMYPGACN